MTLILIAADQENEELIMVNPINVNVHETWVQIGSDALRSDHEISHTNSKEK